MLFRYIKVLIIIYSQSIYNKQPIFKAIIAELKIKINKIYKKQIQIDAKLDNLIKEVYSYDTIYTNTYVGPAKYKVFYQNDRYKVRKVLYSIR